MREWQGKKVVIVGAARQGIALTRYLAGQGARIVLNDCKPASELLDAWKAIKELSDAGYPIEWVIGGHPLSLLDTCDVLGVSGGVSLTLPLVRKASSLGIPIVNDSQVFMEVVPCKVVGITGSAGKTTTTSLVGHILKTATSDPQSELYGKRVWIGGNIGIPLITFIEDIQPDDVAVMELSSFQLELMTKSPHIAVVLNISPDHLDRHVSMKAYINAKTRILEFQTASDTAVIGRDDANAWSLSKKVRGGLMSFGLSEMAPDQDGSFIKNDSIYVRIGRNNAGRTHLMKENFNIDPKEYRLLSRDRIPLRGEHNLRNVMAACTISVALDLPAEIMQPGIEGFEGIPHRLEFIRSWGGADWYNDSIATTPKRAMAAIHSFDVPLVLLAGGRDKNLPWMEFYKMVCQRVDHLIVFGEASQKILQELDFSGTENITITQCVGLYDAVQEAARIVQPGEVVLLSPGGTSFDEFENYEQRGEHFAQWVKELP